VQTLDFVERVELGPSVSECKSGRETSQFNRAELENNAVSTAFAFLLTQNPFSPSHQRTSINRLRIAFDHRAGKMV
jgi:hypothetical protein